MNQPKYKRVLLKISGEALAGDAHRGLNFDVIGEVCDVIKKCVDAGVQIGIVVSGEGRIRCGENALPVKQGSEVFFPCQVRDAVFEGDFSIILCNPGVTAEYK